jgi:hypothetical protein
VVYILKTMSLTVLPKAQLVSTASKHPAWKGKLLHWSGRLTLVRTTLSAIPIYTTISIDKALWKIMTAFLWSGTEVV